MERGIEDQAGAHDGAAAAGIHLQPQDSFVLPHPKRKRTAAVDQGPLLVVGGSGGSADWPGLTDPRSECYDDVLEAVAPTASLHCDPNASAADCHGGAIDLTDPFAPAPDPSPNPYLPPNAPPVDSYKAEEELGQLGIVDDRVFAVSLAASHPSTDAGQVTTTPGQNKWAHAMDLDHSLFHASRELIFPKPSDVSRGAPAT